MDLRLLDAIFACVSFLSCVLCGVGAGRNIKDKEGGIAGGYIALALLFSQLFMVAMVIGMLL